MSERINKLLDMYDKECDLSVRTQRNIERALYLVLRKYQDRLPEPDDYFHKSFRQTDVTGDAGMDMVIWHLLHACKAFWECFDKVNNQDTAGVEDAHF